MEYRVLFTVNENIYLKNPDDSELGRTIVSEAVNMIHDLGFEAFTFKKLSQKINTTEASVYRYFENKHRLLLYILSWYWTYLLFHVSYEIQNIKSPKSRIKEFIFVLSNELPETSSQINFNREFLNQIVISESSKVYLVKDVTTINELEVFKPYKELCHALSEIIKEYNPKYKYPHSLSSTIIEMAHQQQFFCANLPRLTDNKSATPENYTVKFIEDFVFRILG